MEAPPEHLPQILTPCSSGRRSSADSRSPEFEFWMIRNPSFPQPNLHSADELFSNGVLLPLPLHRLHLSTTEDPPPPPQATESGRVTAADAESSSVESSAGASSFTSSKRWRDIFKKYDKKDVISVREKDVIISVREKRREKKNGGGGGVTAAELNINIWPFSRSRSAGNGGARPRPAAATRKVSSAPCSRSNSAGESKFRKWPPNSPSRAGVHLGRSSPVWQVRRSVGGGGVGRISETVLKGAEKGLKKDGIDARRNIPGAGTGGSKVRVLALNVPMCIGYRQHLGCRSVESNAGGITAGAGGGAAGEGVRGSNLFNIRSLFTKKVY
ncbi:hypothetical protein ABFS82_13G129500 [Erythranthe guttata]|uniref:Uncharacterized protein n=1 Tax=Erythranthe guttata TaxID=4155 RepID=A0A022QG68_ERYGU|nr:PREDICTED: uncharacterized protein LOC105968457 [Erythranthe guttata]EYU27732.1 hypothetical protein MIMGU_mgv1a009916mg [Erythranthe guttata]|eukprot:XP_012848545.1 PREDICTED: uncharacterized protein LOC105968457 [Erythranthe guttata]